MLELANEFLKALAEWSINGFELSLIVGSGYLLFRGVLYIAEGVKAKLFSK